MTAPKSVRAAHGPLFVVALTLDLRRRKLLGPHWSDVDSRTGPPPRLANPPAIPRRSSSVRQSRCGLAAY
jgi:hypothetical protein